VALAAEARIRRVPPSKTPAEEDAVRVEVNPNICEGHGQCNAVAPEIYDLDEDGYGLINNPEVHPDLESQAEQGALACPVQAITMTR
jgi:ferredoxin